MQSTSRHTSDKSAHSPEQTTPFPSRARSLLWRFAGVLLVGALVGLLGACDTLDRALEVEAQGRVAAEEIKNPANANQVLNGAIGQAECAFSEYNFTTAVASDEFTGNSYELELRSWTKGGGQGWVDNTCGDPFNALYKPLQTARWYTDRALELFQNEWSDDEVQERTRKISMVAAYAGYSYVLLGESMCRVVLDDGTEMTPMETFAVAEQRFTTAIENAQTDAILYMAYVGRARARQNMARSEGELVNPQKLQQAASDAAQVPGDFVGEITHSEATERRFNQVRYGNTWGASFAGLAPKYRTMNDPRVPVGGRNGTTGGGNIEVWNLDKYTSFSSNIPLATGDEAKLIRAEAALEDNRPQDAVGLINDVRENAGLSPFSSSNPQEIWDQLYQERVLELFAEGKRFGDIRRYNLDLDPAPGTTHPSGNVEYRDQRCFPVPNIEINNNPNL